MFHYSDLPLPILMLGDTESIHRLSWRPFRVLSATNYPTCDRSKSVISTQVASISWVVLGQIIPCWYYHWTRSCAISGLVFHRPNSSSFFFCISRLWLTPFRGRCFTSFAASVLENSFTRYRCGHQFSSGVLEHFPRRSRPPGRVVYWGDSGSLVLEFIREWYRRSKSA